MKNLQERQKRKEDALKSEIKDAKAKVKECYSNIKKAEREHSDACEKYIDLKYSLTRLNYDPETYFKNIDEDETNNS